MSLEKNPRGHLETRQLIGYTGNMAAIRIPIEVRIRRALRRPMSRKALCNRLQVYPVRDLDAVLGPMIESGQVATEKRKGARGKPATVYSLTARRP